MKQKKNLLESLGKDGGFNYEHCTADSTYFGAYENAEDQ